MGYSVGAVVDGDALGKELGAREGWLVGTLVGEELVGKSVGYSVGAVVDGDALGEELGAREGWLVGTLVGEELGVSDGDSLRSKLGVVDGN